MNINDAILELFSCKVVIGIDTKGDVKLIKNTINEKILSVNDGLEILYKLFNQEIGIDYFDEAFHKDFKKLCMKYFKRMKFNEC